MTWLRRPRHRRGVSVAALRERLFREQWFVRPIRQCVIPGDGSPSYLEEIDIYGRRTYLGRL